MPKGLQIAVGGALISVLLGWYGLSQVKDTSFAYYQTLDEFRAATAASRGASAPARVHGYVAPGSIERDVAGRRVVFRVQGTPPHATTTDAAREDGGTDGLPVVYASLETPDLFKDGAEVVVEGRLEPDAGGATFHATNVLAKCPSKFEGREPPGSSS